MRVYIIDQNNVDIQEKILKKKVAFEGYPELYRRKKRFMNKSLTRDTKRSKKHAFRKHTRK